MKMARKIYQPFVSQKVKLYLKGQFPRVVPSGFFYVKVDFGAIQICFEHKDAEDQVYINHSISEIKRVLKQIE